jgi:hypothetical protein
MTLPRNRNVGSFADIDRGHARFDNPTSNPRLIPKNQQNRERELPDLVLKIRAEWIRAGKFASAASCQEHGFLLAIASVPGAQLQPMKSGALIVRARHARPCAGHPRLTLGSKKDAGGRDPAAPRLRRAFQCWSAEALAKAGKPGDDGMAGGIRREAQTASQSLPRQKSLLQSPAPVLLIGAIKKHGEVSTCLQSN